MALTMVNSIEKDEDVFIYAHGEVSEDVYLCIGEVTNVMSLEQAVEVVKLLKKVIKENSDMVAKRKEEFDEYNQNPDNGA